MKFVRDFADERLIDGCVYCGGKPNTREHVPSRIFLQKPFPENLPVVFACFECNNSFSIDEEYVACLLECIVFNTTNPDRVGNSRVSKILTRNPALKAMIKASKYTDMFGEVFQIDNKRLHSIIRKLGIGHAVFELSLVCRNEPVKLTCNRLTSFSEVELSIFESAQRFEKSSEIGSRNVQRLKVVECYLQNKSGEKIKHTFILNDWIVVQEGVYRYHVVQMLDTIIIKIVLNELWAFEIHWDY